MKPWPLRLEVDVRNEGTTSVVAFAGELDLTTAESARDHVDRLVRDGACSVVVDLAGVTFIDLSGLHAIEAMSRAVRRAGGELAIRRPPRMLQRMAEVIGISERLDLAAPP